MGYEQSLGSLIKENVPSKLVSDKLITAMAVLSNIATPACLKGWLTLDFGVAGVTVKIVLLDSFVSFFEESGVSLGVVGWAGPVHRLV